MNARYLVILTSATKVISAEVDSLDNLEERIKTSDKLIKIEIMPLK